MEALAWGLVLFLSTLGVFTLGYVTGRRSVTMKATEAPEEAVSPGVAPLEPELKVPSIVERLGTGLPAFGKAELVTYRHEDYEEWLSCCSGGEILVPGQQVYIIPFTNGDGILALCLNHREIPAKEKTP